MTLFDYLHEEYHADDDLVLFRCTECGQTHLSIGRLHAHVESHRGYTRLGIQVPFTRTSLGDFGELMDRTEVLRVDDSSAVSLSQVDEL
jgi:hypothetical protein